MIELILRRPRTCLAVMVALTLAVGSAGLNTQFDASLKTFILEDDPDHAFHQTYRKTFGQDEILVIAFEDDEIFRAENLALIRRLTRRIEDLDNIHDVRSLTNVEYMHSTEDSFEVLPLIGDEIPLDQGTLATKKDLAIKNPIFREDLISRDGRKTSIVVTLAAMDAGYRYHHEIREIRGIVRDEAARADKTLHLAGERYLDYRLLHYIHDDISLFIPLTCVALAVLLFLMFRNVRETVIGLAAVLACLLWVGGLVPLTGWKVNSVTAGLPSLVLCIAVTDVIHIIHRYRRVLAMTPERMEALRKTLHEVALPCFLTSLTTAIGFGSLMLNDIHLIRGFGLLAALGVGICYPACMVIVGGMLQVWPGSRPRNSYPSPGVSHRWMAAIAEGVIGKRKQILVGGALLIALAIAGVFRVEVQTDRVRYLHSHSDVFQSVDFIDRHLAGTTELDIWVEGGGEGAMKEPATLNRIERLARFLRKQPEIDKVICINDFLKDMNKAFQADDMAHYVLPRSREVAAQFLLIYGMSGNRNELDKYVDYPYSRARLSVRTSEQNSAKLDLLIARINAYLADSFGDTLTANLASAALPNNNVFHYMVRGLLLGLGVAVGIVGLVLAITFRSLWAGFVCMLPNLVPIIACLGIMGWCGVWLEIATAMTFSIALGIAVDDTIHFVSRYRLELNRQGDSEMAVRRTIEGLGPALIRTSIVIMGGFLVLLFASLRMNVMFGLLSAFIILIALMTDLFITPLCLLMLRPFAQQQSARVVPTQPVALRGTSRGLPKLQPVSRARSDA